MPSFVSIKRAIDLQYEVSNNLLLDGSLPPHRDPFPKWPTWGSILKTTKSNVPKNVTFAADADPLSNEAVLISGPQDRLTDQENEYSRPSRNPDVPQQPHHGPGETPPVPNFVQDIFAQFEATGFQAGVNWMEGFTARTWYLHHQAFPRWRVPRFVELDHDWSRWSHEIANAWRDMIDRRIPFHLTVVQPDPYRQYLHRRADVDIILAQETEPGLHAGFLTVTQSSFVRHRTFAVAITLPEQVSGLQIVESADLTDVCATSVCHLSFRWDELQLDNLITHEMHDGHGFQLNIGHLIPPSAPCRTRLVGSYHVYARPSYQVQETMDLE